MSSGLIRWSGLAAMLGGVLWALWGGVEQSSGWGQPGTTAYERYELVNRLLPFALLPVVVGFIGLHVAQRRSYGQLGTAGFVTVLVGLMLVTAGNVGEFWVFSDQSYVGAGRNASWALFLIGHLVLAIGTLSFGIATVRAKVFPREVAILFTAMGVGVVVPFLGAVIFAIPFVWLGYLLWSSKYGEAEQPPRVR
jgi:drug/metabolite transporter (DMT)-like permease